MSDQEEGRIHAMDALRASTMLLLVPVHAAVVLSLNGHPGAWAVAIFWLVHVFRLPLFFAMSGFFLTLLISRKGLGETLRNRTVRIVVPLAVGLVTLVPLFFAVSEATGVSISGDGRPTHGGPFQFQSSFLWFLWYLLILDGIAISVYLLMPGAVRRLGRGMRSAIAHPLAGIALLAVPTAVALWPQPEWTAEPGASSFVPNLSTLSYNALFFGLGATLCAHRELIGAARDRAWRWAACAVAAVLPAAALFTLHNSAAGGRVEIHGAALLIYAVATWTSLIALIGLATRYLNKRRPRVRYLADSSYWIYLSHMPAMVLIIALIGTTALGTAPQFFVVTIGSLAFSMLTYPLLVRYTVIGRVLNGARRRPARSALRGKSAPSLPTGVTPPAKAAAPPA